MKKKLVALCAALMALTMTTPVLAAPSPSADDIANPVKKVATVVDGKEVELVVDGVSKEVIESAKNHTKESEYEVDILSVIDISLPEGVEMPKDGLKVTFEVDGVKSKDKIYLLHGTADGVWEVIEPSEVEYGKITATFKSFSPVAVIRLVEEPVIAPPTGQSTSVLPITAIACLVGVIGCVLKIKFS